MKVFLISLLLFCSPKVVTIYSYTITGCNGSDIKFNQFRHKKILLVNIASGSAQAYQLQQLQQLQSQHQDSLIIVGFPSNSFGNEPKSDSELVVYLQQQGISFPVAMKSSVRGTEANAIYRWLGSKLYNDAMNADVDRDFQKFLVDSRGRLVGQYDSSISPLSSTILNALHKYE
ncbi:MAG: hypothetical protein JST02_10760 [Bacteroidetes bacterium]|nr:hypothetical protein [Bacteroidota bacterium]